MVLAASSYGKGRVRIMRVQRDDDRHTVRELSVLVMLHGGFDRAYTVADNRAVIATDTIKNIVNIVASENVGTDAEKFSGQLANRFLERYAQVERVAIRTYETRWSRMVVGGELHPHGFLLDANGKPTVHLSSARDGSNLRSGIDDFTFLKSTGSGWVDYVQDDYTTLAETDDRIAATSMTASWLWSSVQNDYAVANATVLRTMLESFATTYSHSIQDSLFRMGEAALAAMPDVTEVAMSCPNKHYLPIDLSKFDLDGHDSIFTPTDEPHGQIECVVRR